MQKGVLIAALIASGAAVAGIFFWIGFASRQVEQMADTDTDTNIEQEKRLADRYRRLIRSDRGFAVDDVPPLVSASRLRETLQIISSQPHITGQPGNERTAIYHKAELNKLEGFEVFSKKYHVSLGSSNDSYFEIRYADGTTYKSQVQEKILSQYENLTGQINPILSFTPAGDVTGRVVYANYGREQDFMYLRDNLKINLNGTIALMRYGGVGRGKKLVNAHAFGCVGGIVFSDPANNWAQVGRTNASDVYPNTWWLPPTGVQRGSAKMRQADPQTSHYPSLPYVFRESFDDIKAETDPRLLSPIPGYPVGYGDAEVLLRALAGPNASASAQGGLPLVYKAGGTFRDGVVSVRLVTTNQIDERVEAENIHAVMKGDQEPDRYMLVGNHRDAWNTGPIDPSSGSATMLEMARALSSLYKRGWRPRRSIMLCSWDAEEQGIMGSWEWVEDKYPQIRDKAVAYFNIDVSVHGNYTLVPGADPLMQEGVLQTLRNLPSMNQGGKSAIEAKSLARSQAKQRTMYDDFKERWLDIGRKMPVPLSGSDYSPFIQMAGVPVIDVSYVANPEVSTFYPIYHSMYETFYAMEKFIDPDFRIHKEVTVWATEVVRMFAHSLLLPYSETDLVKAIKEMYVDTKSPEEWGWIPAAEPHKKQAITAWSAFGDTLARLETAAANVQSHVAQLQRQIDAGDATVDPMMVRGINDRRMRSMQALMDYKGQPRNPTVHNLFYASRSEDVVQFFTRIPGLSDLLALTKKRPNDMSLWKKVAQHASALAFRAQSLEYQMHEAL